MLYALNVKYYNKTRNKISECLCVFCRQIHPVLEKGGNNEGLGGGGVSGKYGQLPPLPPNALNGRKSLNGIDECKVPSAATLSPSPPPTGFIHVNSGRIELVSNRFNAKADQQQSHESKLSWRNGPGLIKGGNKGTANDARHSWCGSVFRVSEQVNLDIYACMMRTKCVRSLSILMLFIHKGMH